MLRLCLFLLLATPILAQDLKPVIESREPITNRIIFVLDRSGSMRGWELQTGISAISSILQMPTDDTLVGVVAFNGTAVRWEGVKEDGIPPGWAAFPSATALAKVQSYLTSLEVGGTTKMAPALQLALQDPMENLTVILVSDGHLECNERLYPTWVASLVESSQQARKQPARIFCLGIGCDPQFGLFRHLAESYNGGFYVTGGAR